VEEEVKVKAYFFSSLSLSLSLSELMRGWRSAKVVVVMVLGALYTYEN